MTYGDTEIILYRATILDLSLQWMMLRKLLCKKQLTQACNIALIPPTVYYSRVGFELGKLVYRGQKWNPPYVTCS